MNKVIYTALFSQYEELKEPRIITPGWKYICYTDQPLISKTWEIVKVDLNGTNPQLLARYYKIMEWVDWEKSIWVDASFVIDTNLDDWWSTYFKAGLSAPRHPWRQCVYEEILACIIGLRGDKAKIQEQDKQYKAEGVPKNQGIIASGLLMRENTERVIELCEAWWKELVKHSIRDQVAFAKVSLNFKDVLHTYDWDYRKEKDFIYMHHYQQRYGNRMPDHLKKAI